MNAWIKLDTHPQNEQKNSPYLQTPFPSKRGSKKTVSFRTSDFIVGYVSTFAFNQAMALSLLSLYTWRSSSPFTSQMLRISSDVRQPVSLLMDGWLSSNNNCSNVLN